MKRPEPVPRAKREEFKTYRELALTRDLKSIRRRRRLEATGRTRVIGNGTAGQPYLAVEARRHREVRLEVQRELLLEARKLDLPLPLEKILEQLRPRVDALVYDRLAIEVAQENRDRLPVAALGRALTAAEKKQFAAAQKLSNAVPPPPHRSTLDRVLGQIERRQVHNPARYQTLWAQVVGAEIAQQTHLEQVDAATQTAWFRCANSVLSSDLQRRPGLVEKLSRALGLPVRKLRARF
jgi:hypothetical protein